MNNKALYSVIFVLLLSMTVHEAHAAVSHDIEVCEVCIHVQSSDDTIAANNAVYLVFDTALHKKAAYQPSITINAKPPVSDLIRGPPTHS